MQSKKRILYVWYEYSLLIARKLILEEAGFVIAPAFSFGQALEIFAYDDAFDLVVMGQSMPRSDQKVLISARPHWKVLSVRKPEDKPLPEAEFSVDSEGGMNALIAAIFSATHSQQVSARCRSQQ